MTNAGTSPTRQQVLARLKSLQRAHGLRERSFHSLRHFFCTELGRRGVGAEVVRVLAGHSSLQVTQRYMHANDDDKRAAVAKLAR